jgi:hypothetical protein
VLDRPQRPFFRPGVRGVDEGFGQIDLSAVAQIRGEPFEQAIEPPTLLPELKSAMAGLVGRIAGRQIGPGRARPQDPEHAVKYGARIGPRPATSIGTAARAEGWFEKGPLGVGEIHAARYDGSRSVVTRPVTDL